MTADMSTPLFSLAPVVPGRTHRRPARRLGVFDDNRSRPIHRWYPFVEGYSDQLVGDTLAEVGRGSVVGLLDPFGGCGTTALAAALRGYDTMFCEVNPYLAWVADVKINVARASIADDRLGDLLLLADLISGGLRPGSPKHALIRADEQRGFFPPGVSRLVVGLLERIDAELHGPVRELARLAVSTSLIPASNMVRRTDLRKRHSGDPTPLPFAAYTAQQLRLIHEDVVRAAPGLSGIAIQVAGDARELVATPHPVSLIITSPPYLNGTNYFRNTKLELLALGMIGDEQELAELRAESITAGINNVSRRRSEPVVLPNVEKVASKLDSAAYDRRIPRLVRLYFSDMKAVFAAVHTVAANRARFHMDIGDSCFAGIHVPTPDLLADVAATEGWRLESSQLIRRRRSYNGTALEQVLLTFEAEPAP
ncbi:MAG: hypothetical protein ABR925_06040 [Acidimicrobiales bacterium]|jgi:hypothetical protein